MYRYRGITDKQKAFEVLEVTSETKTIQGVQTTVLHDRNYVAGRLAEDTLDWYGQDRQGNAGTSERHEADRPQRQAEELRRFLGGGQGRRRGRDLHAGQPKVGQTLQQEYYKGHAEDFFKVVDLRGAGRRCRT